MAQRFLVDYETKLPSKMTFCNTKTDLPVLDRPENVPFTPVIFMEQKDMSTKANAVDLLPDSL